MTIGPHSYGFIPTVATSPIGLSIAAGSMAAAVAMPITGPVKETVAQAAWAGSPVILPSPGALFDALIHGFLSKQNTIEALKSAGVNASFISPEYQTNIYTEAWKGVANLSLKRISPEILYGAYMTGAIDRPTFESQWKHAGTSELLWKEIEPYLKSVPSVEHANMLLTRGYATIEQWQNLVIRAGGDPKKWSEALRGYWSTPTTSESLLLLNRGLITDDELDVFLHRQGFNTRKTRELIASLRFQVPSISDLITMQVHEAFDPAIGNALGLYDERPDAIEPYFGMQGLGWGPEGLMLGGEQPRAAKWSDMYWAMHWRPVSPEQVFRMWHVLRPERIQRYRDRGLNVDPVDLAYVRRWLRIQDYPKTARDYLAAIAFTPLRLVDIRNVLRFNIQGRQWAVEQFRDRGLHPNDAEVVADLAIAQEQRRRNANLELLEKNAQKAFNKAVLDGYRTGLIEKDVAEQRLVVAGVKREAAELWTSTIDAEIRIKTVNQTVQLIRKRYMDGVIDRAQAGIELNAAGITNARAIDYLALWLVQHSRPRRLAATQKILAWHRDGLINRVDAANRLVNLGWSDVDGMLHLAEVQIDLLRDQAKSQQALQRSARAATRDLERIQSSLESQQRRVTSEIRRLNPIATLKRWVKSGLINVDTFRTRARNAGYPPDDTERYLREAFGGEASAGNGASSESAQA